MTEFSAYGARAHETGVLGMTVTVWGPDLIFSIIHLSPLVYDSPFMFTILTMFLTDIYQYAIW